MFSFHGTKAPVTPLRVSGGLRGRRIRWGPEKVCMAGRSQSTQIRASYKFDVPVMVNSCCGKMGKAVIEAAHSAGLDFIPVSFGSFEKAGQTVEICGKVIQVHGPLDRESILASVFREHPNMIVVDFTVSDAVNSNTELYTKVGVSFVMGTIGGDRTQLYKTVEESNVYSVISPQMGKEVVALLSAMEIKAEQFPSFCYSLEVTESHQIPLIRDSKEQVEMVGVPEEHLLSHVFHMYHVASPDQTVSCEFRHNVCDRSSYAEGTIDAVLFLAKKVQQKADKRIFNMIDVLREGDMR